MTRTWLVRLKAVALASLLLSGGGGMPLLDVALFHARPTSYSFHPHFEAADASDGHGDYCRQGTAVPPAPETVGFEPAIRVTGITYHARLGAPDSVLPSADLRLLPRPRAPPSHRLNTL
jgi:hypothetical protein